MKGTGVNFMFCKLLIEDSVTKRIKLSIYKINLLQESINHITSSGDMTDLWFPFPCSWGGEKAENALSNKLLSSILQPWVLPHVGREKGIFLSTLR